MNDAGPIVCGLCGKDPMCCDCDDEGLGGKFHHFIPLDEYLALQRKPPAIERKFKRSLSTPIHKPK